MKRITLLGRVDQLQIYQGADVVEFFRKNGKLSRKFKFEVKYLHHDDYEFIGNAGKLQQWAKKYGYKETINYDSSSDEEIFVRNEHFKVLENIGNSQVFFEFSQSCKNFVNYCCGGVLCREGYTYKNSRIHRLNGAFFQGGDVVDSTGNNSVASFLDRPHFENECFDKSLMSDRRGVVGYIPCGRNGNGSQFYFTLEDGSWMSQSGKYQNIGRVISGLDVLDRLKGLETNESEKPSIPLVISDCGVFFLPKELEVTRKENEKQVAIKLDLEKRKRALIIVLKDEFEMIDLNKDKFIVLDELKRALDELYQKKFSWEYVTEVLRQLDINKDSKISEDEYVESMFRLLSVEEMEEEFRRIKRQRKMNEIKKKKLEMVKAELRKSFQECDVNGDAFITEDEVFVSLQIIMGKIPSDDDIEKFFEFFDQNKSGRISYEEFETSMLKLYSLDEHVWRISQKRKLEKEREEKKLLKAISHLRRSFNHADIDNDGYIDSRELKLAFHEIDGQRMSDDEVRAVFAHCDKNGDDLISETEYIESLLSMKTVDELISELKELERKIKEEKVRKKNIALIKLKLSQVFDRVDDRRTLVIDPNQLRLLMKLWTGLLPSFESTKQLYFEIDIDRSGDVEKHEWVRGMMDFFSIEENVAFIKKAFEKRYRVDIHYRDLLIEEISKQFSIIDARDQGFIQKSDLEALLKGILCVDLSKVDIGLIFQQFDNPEIITLEDLLKVLVNGVHALEFADCFREYEMDYEEDEQRQEREFLEEKDGFIDREELRNTLRSLLGREPSEVEFNKFLKKFDDDGDDKIEKDEFLNGILRSFRMEDLIELFKT